MKKLILILSVVLTQFCYSQLNTIHDLNIPNGGTFYDELNSLRTLNLYPNGDSGFDLTGRDYKVLVNENGEYPDNLNSLKDFLNDNIGFRYRSINYDLICNNEIINITDCGMSSTECPECDGCVLLDIHINDNAINTLWPNVLTDSHTTTTTTNCGGTSIEGNILGSAPLVNFINYSMGTNNGFPLDCSDELTDMNFDPNDSDILQEIVSKQLNYITESVVSNDENKLTAGYDVVISCASEISSIIYLHLDNLFYNLKKFNYYAAAGNNNNIGVGNCNMDFSKEILNNDFFSLADICAQSKNTITIGAVNDERVKLDYFSTGTNNSQVDNVNHFNNGIGPALDGRIKPELVTLDYATSFATPSACGGGILLNEHWANFSGCEAPLASTIKALLIHTADNTTYLPPNQNDIGSLDIEEFRPEFYDVPDYDAEDYNNFPSGPNFASGYGFIDIEEAANLISHNFNETNANQLENIFNGVVLDNGEEHNYYLKPISGENLKITLVWNDIQLPFFSNNKYECNRNDFNDIPCMQNYDFFSGVDLCSEPFMEKTLVNDLDIKLIDESVPNEDIIYFPWTLNHLNPIKPARRNRKDSRNNIEQIFLRSDELDVNKIYRLNLNHFGILLSGNLGSETNVNSSQDYSLIITGAELTEKSSNIINNIELRDYTIIDKYENPEYLEISDVVNIDGSVLGNKILIDDDIVVSGELNIGNDLVVMFGDNVGIDVLKGGKLTIGENTILQKSECSSGDEAKWKGIRVEGEWFAPHPTDITAGSTEHGIVIANGATIRDAITAIGVKGSVFPHNPDDHYTGLPLPTVGETPTGMGSGIVQVDNCEFINNDAGVYIGYFNNDLANNEQLSHIKSCNFENTETLSYNHHKRVGVYFRNSGNVEMINNTFKGHSSTNGEEQGIGIISINSNTDIGAAEIDADGNIVSVDDVNANTFENLFKGIDIYNPLSVLGVTNVYGNNFTNVQKGITLNTSPSATIHSNNFDVPCSGAEQSYAIFVESCTGFEIRENCIQATDEIDCTERRGLVLSNTNFEEENRETYEVNENSFIDMKIGTQFDGNNRNAQLRCNYYRSLNGTDWLISGNGELDNQPILPLDNNYTGITAFSGRWDDTKNGTDNYHIDNNNSDLFLSIYHDANSEPTINTGNLVIQGAVDIGLSNTLSCVYDNCAGIDGSANPNDGDNGNATSTANCIKNIGIKVRKKLRRGKLEEAQELLECAGYVWSDKILVATYVGKRQFTNALERLERIPDNTPNNTNFKNLFYAVIQEQQDGSGKKLYTELETTDFVEQIDLKNQKPFAESIIAGLFGNIYDREAESITRTNESVYNLSKDELLVYPNPTSSNIRINVDVNNEQEFKIFNNTGIQVLSGIQTENRTINIENLSEGIYYLQLANGQYSRFVVVD